ncbi:GGDEF domain-containing protein, partial [Streptococcus pyogenes]
CFGRMGGEEFAVVLRRPDQRAVADVAERIRAAVEAQPFGTARLPVSVSVGAAIGERGESVGSIISRADNALYDVKKAGRN